MDEMKTDARTGPGTGGTGGKSLAAFIFARGGSKGIKDKNIRPVGGKPLIAHSIDCALASSRVARVIVSTDSADIAAAAERHGAEVLLRPAHLAADDTPEILAWRHALDAHPDLFGPGPGTQSLFISLPATSPLRAPADVDAAIARFQRGGCDVVFGISPSRRNPHLNMVTVGEDGLIRVVIEGSGAYRRQDVPDVFDITTCVYVAAPDFVRGCKRLMDGRVGHVLIPVERSLDIDEEFDLYQADLMLTHPFKGRG